MQKNIIHTEINYVAVRSSGAGGQHVNKVSSKVILSFDLNNSNGLTDQEKLRLTTNLENRLTKEGILLLSCEESRSQFRNKALITERFFKLLEEHLKRQNIRRKTKPTRGSKMRKLKAKKQQSEKKNLRKKPKL